jgi:serine/threonine-protein kinase
VLPPQKSSGDRVAGWRLLRPLGQGASGVVFLAVASGHESPVALKLLHVPLNDEPARQAFLEQARLAQELSYPDIVRLVGAGIEDEIAWLAMEAAPGTGLNRYTHKDRLLPEALVLHIGERIARALAYAHRQGVVHRDLKPANVLVHLPSDSVKLVDFGLARPVGAEATRTGVIPGTPAYMAPEQLAGVVPDARCDLYALGVTLFELLSGRLPHEAATMGELLRRVAQEPAPDLRALRPDAPAALVELMARLLARDRTAREADAQAVADALRAIRPTLAGASPR